MRRSDGISLFRCQFDKNNIDFHVSNHMCILLEMEYILLLKVPLFLTPFSPLSIFPPPLTHLFIFSLLLTSLSLCISPTISLRLFLSVNLFIYAHICLPICCWSLTMFFHVSARIFYSFSPSSHTHYICLCVYHCIYLYLAVFSCLCVYNLSFYPSMSNNLSIQITKVTSFVNIQKESSQLLVCSLNVKDGSSKTMFYLKKK